MATLRLAAVLLLMLVPSCLCAETYMWTDEDGNTNISSEKPPAHITDFETIGQSDASQENDQDPTNQVQDNGTTSQYDDFPPLILEKIKITARNRWPNSEKAQNAMIDREVKACRYVLNSRNLNFPVAAYDRIMGRVEHKWPNGYEQQADYIKKQYRSYQAIITYENLDLSDVEINQIKENAAGRWPFDYSKQEQFIRREAKYYVERKSN